MISFKKKILDLNIFTLLICGFFYEYNLATVATILRGENIFQWILTVFISTVFFIVGKNHKIIKTKILSFFICLGIIISFLGYYSSKTLLYFFNYYYDHYVLYQYFFVALLGYLIGLSFSLSLAVKKYFNYKKPYPFYKLDFTSMIFILFLCLLYYNINQTLLLVVLFNLIIIFMNIIFK